MVQKLSWYRKGGEGSERQWRDVLGVLKVQGTKLDRRVLRDAAVSHAVLDLLDRALVDAGLGS